MFESNIPRSLEHYREVYNVNYDDCISQYGNANADWCAENTVREDPTFFDHIGGFFGTIFGNLPLIIAVIMFIIFLAASIKIIRQKQVGVVERFGRYNRSLQAGFHMIIPVIEKVVERVDLQQYNIDVSTAVKTKEDQVVTLPVIVMVRVNPDQAADSYYEVEEPDEAIRALVSNEVKAIAATMTLQDIYDDRQTITDAVLDEHIETITGYGFIVNTVVIDNPELSEAMEDALNGIAIAEKQKIAATAQGEALKIQLVAQAEAEGASLEIKGKSYAAMRTVIAETNGDALVKLIGDTDLKASDAMVFLTRIDSNDAIRDAASSGATVVLTTGDNTQATLGLLASASTE